MAIAGYHTSHSFDLNGIRTHALLGYKAWCQKSKSHSQRGKKVKSTLTYDVVPRIVKQMTEKRTNFLMNIQELQITQKSH